MTVNKEELLAKAKKPAQEAMRLHPFYKGKIEVTLKSCVRNIDDFAIWYTPGVAEPCKAIAQNKEDVYKYTNKGNFVAVVSDGTRVLGLGDIGAEAAMPVMEGKALLFKYLGGVDAFPICVDTKDPEELIKFVKLMQPCFGGVNQRYCQPRVLKFSIACGRMPYSRGMTSAGHGHVSTWLALQRPEIVGKIDQINVVMLCLVRPISATPPAMPRR